MSTIPFLGLYQAIVSRLKLKVPEVRWIDLDMGQLENYGDRPAVSWPCVLIDFPGIQYEDASEALQFAQGAVVLRLAFPPFSPSNGSVPTLVQEKALKYFEIEDKIFKALHGWKPAEYGYMMRTSASTEAREGDTIRVRVLSYGISFEDNGAVPVRDQGKPSDDLEFTVEWEWPLEPGA